MDEIALAKKRFGCTWPVRQRQPSAERKESHGTGCGPGSAVVTQMIRRMVSRIIPALLSTLTASGLKP